MLFVLIKFIFFVHFCFEAHLLPQNFSNVNYVVLATDMEILLKRKGLWKYTKVSILIQVMIKKKLPSIE